MQYAAFSMPCVLISGFPDSLWRAQLRLSLVLAQYRQCGCAQAVFDGINCVEPRLFVFLVALVVGQWLGFKALKTAALHIKVCGWLVEKN